MLTFVIAFLFTGVPCTMADTLPDVPYTKDSLRWVHPNTDMDSLEAVGHYKILGWVYFGTAFYPIMDTAYQMEHEDSIVDDRAWREKNDCVWWKKK